MHIYSYHEEYIENVLQRKCMNFYNARGKIFAETFLIAMKSRTQQDWPKVSKIWNQRKIKWLVVACAAKWGCGIIHRKAKSLQKGNIYAQSLNHCTSLQGGKISNTLRK